MKSQKYAHTKSRTTLKFADKFVILTDLDVLIQYWVNLEYECGNFALISDSEPV